MRKVHGSMWLPALLLSAYYLGLPLKPIVGVVCILLGLAAYFNRYKSYATITNAYVLPCLLCLYPAVVLAVQLARLHNGTQGVDFAMFSQVVHNFTTGNGLQTSLIDYKWHHFLTHHFSPYLYAFGFVNKAFHNAELLLLFLHSATVACIAALLFLIAFHLDRNIRLALLLTTLGVLLPAPRLGLLWEVRDEIFALPFLLGAYLFWLRCMHVRAVICLVATLFFKETMFVAVASFGAMALAMAYLDDAPRRRQAIVLYGLCFLAGITGFVLYTKVLPGWLFWPTFSAFARVGQLSQFLDLHVIRAKIWWLTTIFAPISPLIILAFVRPDGLKKQELVRLLVLLFPAAPFLGAILLSNSEGMNNPYNYYSILPALLTTVGVFTGLRGVSPELKVTALLSCCLLAALFGPRIRIPKEIKIALVQESPVQRLRQMIPPTAVVITGDWDATFFLRQRQVIRLYHANRNIVKLDFIVRRKTSPSNSSAIRLSRYLRSRSKKCYEDDVWIVRCALVP